MEIGESKSNLIIGGVSLFGGRLQGKDRREDLVGEPSGNRYIPEAEDPLKGIGSGKRVK